MSETVPQPEQLDIAEDTLSTDSPMELYTPANVVAGMMPRWDPEWTAKVRDWRPSDSEARLF